MISPLLSCGLPEMPADRLETGLINLFADHFGELRGLRRPGREPRLPMPKRPVTVGDRQQADMPNVVDHRNWRIEQAIAEGLFEIGERQQLLAQFRAVLQFEPPYAADAVCGLRALDHAGRNRGMPAVMAVK